MKYHLDYGKTGLPINVSSEGPVYLLEHQPLPPLHDPVRAIEESLIHPIKSPPLIDLARGRKNACILICDITRPVPNRDILPPILRTLELAGIPRDQILILVATGLHRPNTTEELIEMCGEDIVRDYRIENHLGKEKEEHTYLGTTASQVPVYLDTRYVSADLKITTGLIEPHLMAGYSGGRKVICPGIASIETIRAWHSPRFLEHPRATAGIVAGNPVHEENTRIALLAGCHFIVNVTLDGDKRITGVVAGHMIHAWEEGVKLCEKQVSAKIPEPVDVVIASSAGYPLDATFYQSVKGMTAAFPVVKKGGTIILAARLSEGIGSPEFHQLLLGTDSLDDFLVQIMDENFFVMDQWQLEELAKVARHARILFVTEGLEAATLKQFFVEPVESVEKALEWCEASYGAQMSVAVMPRGPYTLPVLSA